MKRLLLALIVAAVACLTAVFCLGGVALAEETVTGQYLTENYVDLGEIFALSAYRDTVAVLRAKEGRAYLSILCEATVDEPLDTIEIEGIDEPVTIAPDALVGKQIALYDGYVLMVAADKMCAYDCVGGAWRTTNIPTTLASYDDWSGETTYTPLTQFAVDEGGRVYVCYGMNTLRWLSFADVFLDTKPTVTSTYFAQSAQSFVAHQGVCYVYSTAGKLYAVDTNDTVSVGEPQSVAAFDSFDYAGRIVYFSDGVLREQATDADVVLLQKASPLFEGDRYLQSADLVCTSFDGESWRVFVADNGQSAVKVYDGEGNFLTMYGTWGVDDGRLHNPTYLSHSGQTTVIKDDGNARAVVMRTSDGGTVYTHIDGLATDVAAMEDRVYIARDDLVLCYDYGHPREGFAYTETTYYLPAKVLSVCSDGATVYALTADCLYVLRSAEDAVAQLYVHAVRAKVGRHTGIVYVQTTDAITVYKDLKAVGVSVDVSGVDVQDFDVDYCGNVYVLTMDGALRVYLRAETGYTETTLTLALPLRSLSIQADGSVLGLCESAVVVPNLTVRTIANSAYEAPRWTDPVSVVEITDTVWGYASPNNYESVVSVAAGTFAMCMADHTYQGNEYYYVEFSLSTVGNVRYEKAYIPKGAASPVAYVAPDDMYVRYDGATATTGIYPYPSYSAEAVRMVDKADATFKVLRMMGVKDGELVWRWYMVQAGDTVAYVAADNYVAADPPYVEVERYYARCVAGKLGEKVPVYASPDADGEVVASLVDGTKVELTAPYDADSEYTKIRLGDREVYLRTANVTTRSLTNGQTFALIMSVVVISAAAVTLVLYLLVRKRR